MVKPRYKLYSDGTATLISGPPPTVPVSNLNPTAYGGQVGHSTWQSSIWDGEKFAGGFGATQLWDVDYWTLRRRSKQIFTDNLYGRGLIRRLITNEINIGLMPEATPEEIILGLEPDSLESWTELTETRFGVWARTPELCDYCGEHNFAQLQQIVRRESLVAGDVLVVMRTSRKTGLPQVQLISGDAVQSPLTGGREIAESHTVSHGVERDARKRIAAYWVRQEGGGIKRVPARGLRGRRTAWLVFGTDKLMDDERGQPLLALVLQSLKEIDRYRDSTQRRAVINSILAMAVEQNGETAGTRPFSGGVTRREDVKTADPTGARKVTMADGIPGMVLEQLAPGEKITAHSMNAATEGYGVFEEAVIQAIAWVNELPPEILKLAFSSNYAASQAAVNELKIYLRKFWSEFGAVYCAPFYNAVLIADALSGRNPQQSLLDAWRDPEKYDEFAAWTAADWYGTVKPSADMVKTGKGSEILTKNGWSTNAREARGINGSKFSKNVQRLRIENEQLAAALRPRLELEREFGEKTVAAATETGDPLTLQLLRGGVVDAERI